MLDRSRVGGSHLPKEPEASHYKKRLTATLLEKEGNQSRHEAEGVSRPRPRPHEAPMSLGANRTKLAQLFVGGQSPFDKVP